MIPSRIKGFLTKGISHIPIGKRRVL